VVGVPGRPAGICGAAVVMIGGRVGLPITGPASKATEPAQPETDSGEREAECDPWGYHDQDSADHRVLPGCRRSCGIVHWLGLRRRCDCYGGDVEADVGGRATARECAGGYLQSDRRQLRLGARCECLVTGSRRRRARANGRRRAKATVGRRRASANPQPASAPSAATVTAIAAIGGLVSAVSAKASATLLRRGSCG
jgi:hypothetical protein